jgi:hypothetical protein
MAKAKKNRSFIAALRAELGYNPPKSRVEFKERPRSQENIKPRALFKRKKQEGAG